MLHRTLRLYRNAYRGLSPSVWLLAGVMLINRCGTMVLPFMALYLTQHLHYSVSDTGWVMAVYGAGAFAGTFLGGWLTDRFGFYYVQLSGLLFGGVALLGLQFITHFYALCGSVFVFTLLGDAFRPANQAAISHYSDAGNRTRAFSLNRLAINLGWSLGGGLGGWLAGLGYHLLFWADGLTCLLAGLVLWWFLPVPAVAAPLPSTSEANVVAATTLRHNSPYRDRTFLAFVTCSALYLTMFMQFFSLFPVFCKQVLHLTEHTIGILMTLNGLLIVAVEMALVYSLENRQWPKTTLIAAGSLLTAVAYATLIGPAVPGVAVLFVLGITLGEMFTMPFIQSFTVGRSSPQTRGQYLALYAMGGAVAQTLAPAVGAQLVAQLGFSGNWLAMAGLGVVAAIGFGWLGHVLKRTETGMR